MGKVVFTNGCFDIIHPGHISLLKRARALGSKLIVGLNSDRSVKAIKGVARPIMAENDRAQVLLGLESVDQVIVFDELTPEKIIRQIRPDILVKGGDWRAGEIVGSDFIMQNGGEVVSLPLVEGFSSTNYIQRSGAQPSVQGPGDPQKAENEDLIQTTLQQHQEVFVKMAADTAAIRKCADLLIETFEKGRKVLICGNGGSAADAQHLAAEFVGRYETERKALPAIALTTDTSALTALANDYDFERIFTRQIEALANEGDCLIAISTSGNSRNVISAVMKARSLNCKIIAMTGENGKKLASLCDECLVIPSGRTARIQEGHIAAAHIWCEIIDKYIADREIFSGSREK